MPRRKYDYEEIEESILACVERGPADGVRIMDVRADVAYQVKAEPANITDAFYGRIERLTQEFRLERIKVGRGVFLRKGSKWEKLSIAPMPHPEIRSDSSSVASATIKDQADSVVPQPLLLAEAPEALGVLGPLRDIGETFRHLAHACESIGEATNHIYRICEEGLDYSWRMKVEDMLVRLADRLEGIEHTLELLAQSHARHAEEYQRSTSHLSGTHQRITRRVRATLSRTEEAIEEETFWDTLLDVLERAPELRRFIDTRG